MAITVNTKLIPLLGTPLAQSFSPRMQNAAYQAIDHDAHYFPLEVGTEHLGDIIRALRHMNVPGFAVTKPNKIAVLPYLDELDDLAAKMGACNTVTNIGGVLKGYNTDGDGAVDDLIQAGVNPAEHVFFSLGAGGAGKAVCFTLAHHGAKHIYIASRSSSCETLADELNETFGPIATACRVSDQARMLDMVKRSTVLLNLAGVGMYPNTQDTWIDKAHLSHRPICFDATYNPIKTQFLLDAAAVGCQTINGIGMVIRQGARQIKLWTGQEAPYDTMVAEIHKILHVEN